ncbi:hypothetical protein L2E82_29606 [Cichorium intybus]|uniref:Uncharacterized protein n=1 Tax=Cichorium intybus TaxID=13427 RepID=A0ACB9CXZ5_CICIN|nr:hypothetical protein L2E82_29606 [Cichorium intybus]
MSGHLVLARFINIPSPAVVGGVVVASHHVAPHADVHAKIHDAHMGINDTIEGIVEEFGPSDDCENDDGCDREGCLVAGSQRIEDDDGDRLVVDVTPSQRHLPPTVMHRVCEIENGDDILIPGVECGRIDYAHKNNKADGPVMKEGMVEDAITSDEDESDDEGRYGGDPMMKDGMVEDDITSDEDESDAEHDGMQLEHNRDGDELLVAGKLMEDAAYGGAMSA